MCKNLHYSQEGWNSKTQALGTKSEEMGGLGSWKEELKRQIRFIYFWWNFWAMCSQYFVESPDGKKNN